jgi:hypothetical protein
MPPITAPKRAACSRSPQAKEELATVAATKPTSNFFILTPYLLIPVYYLLDLMSTKFSYSSTPIEFICAGLARLSIGFGFRFCSKNFGFLRTTALTPTCLVFGYDDFVKGPNNHYFRHFVNSFSYCTYSINEFGFNVNP